MEATRQSRGLITFAVDDVVPAERPARTTTGLASSTARMGAQVEACSHVGKHFLAGVPFHPLLAAVRTAWFEHRPLILSPDILWITIAQGVAQHVRMTESDGVHSGHKLFATRPDFQFGSPKNPWGDLVDELSLQLASKQPALRSLMQPDFSTTSHLDRLAGDLALLEAVKPEVEISLRAACGIPEISMEGQPEDWERLESKIAAVASLGLQWWTEKLLPLAAKWCSSAGGRIDRQFWRSIFKTKTNCVIEQEPEEEGIDGWITQLFPYTHSPNTLGVIRRNPMLNPGPLDAGRGEEFPGGLSRIEVVVATGSSNHKLDLAGGFIGIEQVGETGALRPRTGWAVARQRGVRALVERLELYDLNPMESSGRFDDALRRVPCFHNLPLSLLEFYQRFDGGGLHDRGDHPVYFLRPLRRLVGDRVRVRRHGTSEDHLECVLIRFCEFGAAGYAAVLVSSGRGRQDISGKVVHMLSRSTRGKAPVIADDFSKFLERALLQGSRLYFKQRCFKPSGFLEVTQ